MSVATLREAIIGQLRVAHQSGRVYAAPAAWNVDEANANSKALAECLAIAIIPEVSVTQAIDLPMLETIDFPDALPDTIRIFADKAGRVLKRYPNGSIEELNSTDYRP
jgi:hypothetical protein